MMTSSKTNYQTFDHDLELEQSAKEKQETGAQSQRSSTTMKHKMCTNRRLCLLITAVVLIVVMFFAAIFTIGIGVGVGVSQNNDQPQSYVKVFTLSSAELEGEIYSSDLDGQGAMSIYFRSTVNETHFVLTISMTTGELLVTITQPLASNMILFGVNSTNFLLMKNVPGMGNPVYVVPDDMMDVMNAMMSLDGNQTMTSNVLQELDSESVNQTSHDVLYTFTTSPEALLVIEAALALGEYGYQGMDYASLMQFYQLALQIAKMRYKVDDSNDNEDEGTNRLSTREVSLQNHKIRQKRSLFPTGITIFISTKSLARLVYFHCSSHGTSSCTGTSPYDDSIDNCRGLCGHGCCCWDFVCGDCCHHRYCESVDDCCAKVGYLSMHCWRGAINVHHSRCSEEYDCPYLIG